MSEIITGGRGTPEEERNRKAVIDFFEIVVNQKQFDRWPEFLDPGYIQHKPNVANGPDGVLNFMRDVYKRVPNHRARIVRCFVEGDYVVLHNHIMNEPAARDIAVMDIFRCKNGKLLEHWDVDQVIPADFVHNNGMF